MGGWYLSTGEYAPLSGQGWCIWTTYNRDGLFRPTLKYVAVRRDVRYVVQHCLRARIYLPRANFSCHFPLALATAGASPSPATSSTVSCTVAIASSPPATASNPSSWLAGVGVTRIRALDVFFCRSEYVFVGVLRSAAVGDECRVNLMEGGLVGKLRGEGWWRRGE